MHKGQKILMGLRHNWVLKLISLALAVIIWFYISGELTKEKRERQWRKDFLGPMASEEK